MTALTEILNHCKKLISEGHQIDTQGLVHWIEDKLLKMEKQQIIDFADSYGTYLLLGGTRSAATYNEIFNKE